MSWQGWGFHEPLPACDVRDDAGAWVDKARGMAIREHLTAKRESLL